MSSQDDAAAVQHPDTGGPCKPPSTVNDPPTGDIFTVTIGATVPTGFEHTAAEEVKEKIGVDARISKDRGRIYFPITTDKLFQVGDWRQSRPCSPILFCLVTVSHVNNICSLNPE